MLQLNETEQDVLACILDAWTDAAEGEPTEAQLDAFCDRLSSIFGTDDEDLLDELTNTTVSSIRARLLN